MLIIQKKTFCKYILPQLKTESELMSSIDDWSQKEKLDFNVVQIAVFVKYRSTCLSMVDGKRINVQYRRLESKGKIDLKVVQIALFVKYRSTCLSMVSDTVKWGRMDCIRLSLVK